MRRHVAAREVSWFDDVEQLRAEVEGLTEGSAWRHRIMMWLMEAETDERMKELVDEQTRRRMQDLCRTEARYIEMTEALAKADLEVKGGTVVYVGDSSERPLLELLP